MHFWTVSKNGIIISEYQLKDKNRSAQPWVQKASCQTSDQSGNVSAQSGFHLDGRHELMDFVGFLSSFPQDTCPHCNSCCVPFSGGSMAAETAPGAQVADGIPTDGLWWPPATAYSYIPYIPKKYQKMIVEQPIKAGMDQFFWDHFCLAVGHGCRVLTLK